MNLAINAWRFAALNYRAARAVAPTRDLTKACATNKTEDRINTPASVPPSLWFMRAGLVLAAYQARGDVGGYGV